jgi:hypothetical protein
MFDRLLVENGPQMNKIGNKIPRNSHGFIKPIKNEYNRLAGKYLNAPVQSTGQQWVVKEEYRIRDHALKKAKKISRALIERKFQRERRAQQKNNKNGVGGCEKCSPSPESKSLGFINHVLELLQEWWVEEQEQQDDF